MSAARTERRAGRSATRSGSSHLGGRLRKVLLSPRSGFASLRPALLEEAKGSPLPALLVFLGGAGTMLVWLKLTSLMQLAGERTARDVTLGKVLLAALVGAVFGVAAFLLWARLGSPLARRLGGDASGAGLRLVWAFAAFPLAIYTLIFLPLDLLLVGPELFATDRLTGSFEMVWGALSVALALSAVVWTTFLLWRGIEVAGSLKGRAAVAVLLLAFGLSTLLYDLLVLRELIR